MAEMKFKRSGQSRTGPGQPGNTKYGHWRLSELAPRPLGPGPWQPKELFAACSTQEQILKQIDMAEAFVSMRRFYLFSFPLFGDSSNFANEGYPLQFTIGPPKGLRSSKVDWRYTELLRHLKELNDKELRWLLLARWLSAEGVCTPEEFLPAGVLKRMLDKVRLRMMRLSPSDMYLWYLVKIWQPYFEALLTELGNMPKNCLGPGATLLERGYRRDAIESSIRKRRRSPIQAITGWLEERESIEHDKELPARTLENAYSRIEVAMRNADSDFEKLQIQQTKSKLP
jgi:hypothetical protein